MSKKTYDELEDEMALRYDDTVDTSFIPTSTAELEAKATKEIKEFKKLLDGLSSTEDRKKNLWRQIYENALEDRRNSYILFADLYSQVSGHSDQHAIHGPSLSKYMERMSKANDQLIKLADLVSEAVDNEVEENWSEEEMYDMLNKDSE